ncbi:MAG: GNAT family N-acetyltransferase [Rhodospirillaceae bacterium]|jgi:[ribosomal protein S5]-alanine N-acetyltransferase|nr:GNAT family N-acetyltransferase [Rhodospirillaceae bacterium]MBT5666248.1 GNAT family N-acetyltransferase [Rhodospirillaceae bacterium]MBT5809832.1 GNAT family N-acetyltransferase [Rhodospirillaceae bacterium]
MAEVLGFITGRPPAHKVIGPWVMLRPPRRSDEEQWVEIRRVSQDFLVPWEPTWPSDAATPTAFHRRLKRFHAGWRDASTYAFVIVDKDDRILLGGITLSNVRRGVAQSGSIGYWIGEPHTRNGYMGESVQLMLTFAFDTLRLHRVEAACLPSNEASRAVLLKAGFTQEGLARRYLRINGEWRDHLTFGILRTDPRPSVPVYV